MKLLYFLFAGIIGSPYSDLLRTELEPGNLNYDLLYDFDAKNMFGSYRKKRANFGLKNIELKRELE